MLSGIFASYEVNGAAKYGVYSYIKHFAANDQETNRCALLMTYLSEQTLRENVLKPFEMVVKNFNFDSNVMGVMTSYNWLGNVPCVSNADLLQTVLRGEWGFVGAVISDYDGSYGYMISHQAILAGNDLMLGQGMFETNEFTNLDSATTVTALRQASKNILYTVANSGYYADASASQGGMSNMTKIFVALDVGAVAVAVALEAVVLLRWWNKRKKTAAVDQ